MEPVENMHCFRCGKKVDASLQYCPYCGSRLAREEIVDEIISYDNTKTSGFAVAGFVLSLIDLFITTDLFFFLGLIFSAIGLYNTRKNKAKGRGYAIAGLAISAFVFLVMILAYNLEIY